jgi:ribonuclease HII
VRRDQLVAGLRELHGDFGSGYCHDPKTVEYIASWFRDGREAPPFMRASWSTVRKYLGVRETRPTP